MHQAQWHAYAIADTVRSDFGFAGHNPYPRPNNVVDAFSIIEPSRNAKPSHVPGWKRFPDPITGHNCYLLRDPGCISLSQHNLQRDENSQRYGISEHG